MRPTLGRSTGRLRAKGNHRLHNDEGRGDYSIVSPQATYYFLLGATYNYKSDFKWSRESYEVLRFSE